jgi:hypothetical protein
MAKLIEFYIPTKFLKSVKWVSPLQRGRVIEFRLPAAMISRQITSVSVPASMWLLNAGNALSGAPALCRSISIRNQHKRLVQ